MTRDELKAKIDRWLSFAGFFAQIIPGKYDDLAVRSLKVLVEDEEVLELLHAIAQELSE